MLVLTRQVDEEIVIGDDIRVRVLGVHGSQVRLGIVAPTSVPILRREVYEAVSAGNAISAETTPEALRAVLSRGSQDVASV